MQPKNFTKLSNERLIFRNHLIVLGHLTFYRVLTTNELFEISKYPHGIKSFRKLLFKFIRLDLIGFQKNESTNVRYLYPTSRAIQYYKKDQFQKYLMKDVELHTLKTYHTLFKLTQNLREIKGYQSEFSYINDSDALIDHGLIWGRLSKRKTSFFIFFEEDEKEVFQRIKTALKESLTHRVIILSNESDYLMQELITHYLKDIPRKIQWAHWYPITRDLNHPVKHIKDNQIYTISIHELLKEN